MTERKAELREKLRIDVERYVQSGGVIRQFSSEQIENDSSVYNKFINKANFDKLKHKGASREWLSDLKEDDIVIVNSSTFDPLEKKFDRYAQTKAGRGLESERTIVLKKCATRFYLNGRGKGGAEDVRKWLTKPSRG